MLYIRSKSAKYFQIRGFISSSSPLIQAYLYYVDMINGKRWLFWRYAMRDHGAMTFTSFNDLNDFLHQQALTIYEQEARGNKNQMTSNGYHWYRSETGSSSIFFNLKTSEFLPGYNWDYQTKLIQHEHHNDSLIITISEDATKIPELTDEQKTAYEGKQQNWQLVINKRTNTYRPQKIGSVY